MFVARPIVVLVCTLFDRKASWSKNEKLFMMWVRETGVIPAALSGIIVSTKVPGYEVISSVVFMTIIITLLVQASTTKIVAQKLDVLEDENIG
ncbi:MAG: cation:proton antiporter, partial [Romboutsia timonensis]|nr:cation:proton antiporter [Romboutsia timonensis]